MMTPHRSFARRLVGLVPLFALACGGRSSLDVTAPMGTSIVDAASTADVTASEDGAGGIDAGEAGRSCQWGFGPAATYQAGESPVAVTVGDLDGDGHLDLAVDNNGGYVTGNTLDTLRNRGDGTFVAWQSYPSEVAFSLVVGPFESSRSADVIAGCDLFPNQGGGAFGTPFLYETTYGRCGTMVPTDDLVTADFDGDGRLDFAWCAYDSVTVFLSRGAGRFDEIDTTTFASALAPGDFDGDGRVDLAVVSAGYGNPSYLKLLRNLGGAFAETDFPEGNVYPSNVAAGDFNGDGKPDVALVDQVGNTLQVRLGDGSGGFGAPTLYQAASDIRSIAVGDLDGNGSVDLALADFSLGSLDVFFNQGDGTFAPRTALPLENQPYSVSLGDLNGDGHLDIAVAGNSEDATKDAVTVFLSTCQ
jgi:FG-GAP-like repeat/FG-GAP repeat